MTWITWRSRYSIATYALYLCLFAIGFMLGCERVQESSKIIYTPEPRTFKVGMLLPGSIKDQGWNALAHDGLTAIEAELGFHNANEAGLGVFEAVVLAQEAGKTVYAFGANRDQSAVSPRAVLANAVITPRTYLQLATAVKAGTFESKLHVFTMMTDGAIALTYNPELRAQVPEEVQQKVEAARQQILAGTLEVPQIDFSAGE